MSETLLEEMTKIIVETVDPQQIVLFGSQAKRRAKPSSDFDFLIIKNIHGRDRRQEMGHLWRRLARFKVPKDVLIFNPDEVERWRNTKNHIIAHALREGKLLYERP